MLLVLLPESGPPRHLPGRPAFVAAQPKHPVAGFLEGRATAGRRGGRVLLAMSGEVSHLVGSDYQLQLKRVVFHLINQI